MRVRTVCTRFLQKFLHYLNGFEFYSERSSSWLSDFFHSLELFFQIVAIWRLSLFTITKLFSLYLRERCIVEFSMYIYCVNKSKLFNLIIFICECHSAILKNPQPTYWSVFPVSLNLETLIFLFFILGFH